MLLTPVLTMRLLAEERQKRTDQLLLTSPVSITGIVLGKYLAAVALMGLVTALTGLYIGIVGLYGQLWAGEVFVGYLGFVLQGCAFIAIGLFLSCAAPSPVTAAVLSFGVSLILWMMDLFASSLPEWGETLVTVISLYSRNEPFLMGQLSLASVIYDLSVAAAFILLTIRLMDARRLKGA